MNKEIVFFAIEARQCDEKDTIIEYNGYLDKAPLLKYVKMSFL